MVFMFLGQKINKNQKVFILFFKNYSKYQLLFLEKRYKITENVKELLNNIKKNNILSRIIL